MGDTPCHPKTDPDRLRHADSFCLRCCWWSSAIPRHGCRGEGGTALANGAPGPRRPTGRQAGRLTVFLPERRRRSARPWLSVPAEGMADWATDHEDGRSPSGFNSFGVAGLCSNTPIGGGARPSGPVGRPHSGQSARSALSGRVEIAPVGSALSAFRGSHLASTAGTHFDKGALRLGPIRSSESVAALTS